MQIIYLHGFSSAPASHKARRLQDALAPMPLLIADYPSHRPREAIATITALIDRNRRQHPHDRLALMGSSLGGYYAQHLAATRDDIDRVVLINPALDPQPPLEPWIGANTNMVTGEPFHFSREAWEQLADFDTPSASITTPTLLLLDSGDDVIPHEFAAEKYRNLPGRTIVYPGGSHAFDHLDEAIPEIVKFLAP